MVYNSGRVGKNAIHLKATNSQTGGYKDNSWNRSQAFTLKAGHWFNDRHSIEFLSMNGQHRNNQGWIGVPIQELIRIDSTTGFIDKDAFRSNGNTDKETDHWIQSVNKLTYKGWFSDNVVFTSSAYLQFQTGEYRFDMDNYGIRMCGGHTITATEGIDTKWLLLPNGVGYDTLPGGMIYDYGLTHYMYGNMSAVKFYLGDLNLTTGYNAYRYQRQHFMSDKYKQLNLENVDPSEYYDNTGYKNDVSAFVSGNYELGDFEFNGNVQYRYVDFNYKDNMNSEVQYNEDTKWNFVNGGLGVDYNISPYHKVYTRWTHTNREPTRTDMFDGNEFYPVDTLGNHYITTRTPEQVNDFEVGYDINTERFDANLNFYHMMFKNERVLNGEFGVNGLPKHGTANTSFRAGIEYNMDWYITKQLKWTFNGSYSYNKMNYDYHYDDKDTSFVKNISANHILTPSFTIYNDLSYNFGNFTLGISQYYHSAMKVNLPIIINDDTNYVETDSLSVPDYLSLNIYGNYRIKNVELGLRVNNITNRTNYQYGAEGPSGELLYFQEAKLNVFGDIKVFF